MEAFKNLLQQYVLYEASVDCADDTCCAIVKADRKKLLAVYGKEAERFEGTLDDNQIKLCELSAVNAKALMSLFPYTKPKSHQGIDMTIGLGDRLGLATPGHIRAVKKYGAFPVLAQQSMRELKLTGRGYEDVLAAAAFGVFQEGYKDGYGADGDHLKTKDEIKYALNCGFTMITLDCSDYIETSAGDCDNAEIEKNYSSLCEKITSHYEQSYLNKTLPVVGEISNQSLQRIVVMFGKAIEHAVECFFYIKNDLRKNVDFEMSIDETPNSTDPAAHYIIANELLQNGVELTSMAPHFCGEFEKGIDYIGNIEDFRREFIAHQKIAEHFGSYKLSVHSGSDKFSVMSIVGKETNGRFHLKTAGTSWLEAMRAVAVHHPVLYRKAHQFALEHQEEARKYYHISSDASLITNIDYQNDAYLPEYMNLVNARQAIHITYGLLLNEPWFREEFFAFMNQFEDGYYDMLERHIGKHLSFLSGKKL